MPRLIADLGPLRRLPTFRLLWSGELASALGQQVTAVAVALQMYHLTHSTLMVGLIGLAELVPLLAGAVLGGGLADSADRKRIMFSTQLGLVVTSGVLMVNAFGVLPGGRPRVWPLFVMAGLASGLSGMAWPTRRSILRMCVPEEDLTPTAALMTMIQQITLVAGPAIAGVLISYLGYGETFVADVAFGAFSTLTVLGLPLHRTDDQIARLDRDALLDGFRYVAAKPLLGASYLLDLDAMVFGMPRAVFPAIGTTLLHGGAGTISALYAAPGAGALVSSVLTGWCARIAHQGRAVVVAVCVWGACIVGFGVSHAFALSIACLALAGAADVVSAVFRQSIQLRTVPDRLMGRLSGTYFAVVSGGPRLGDVEAGGVAALAGSQVAVWSGGAACIAGALALARAFPVLWHDRIEPGMPLPVEE